MRYICSALKVEPVLVETTWANFVSGLNSNQFDLCIAGTFATDLGREYFAESDLVISAGAGLGHYTTEGGYLFPNAKVVRIDTQPRG